MKSDTETAQQLAEVMIDRQSRYCPEPLWKDLMPLVQEHTRSVLLEAIRLSCGECLVGRPVKRQTKDEWWHTAKEGGDILLPAGRCNAHDIREKYMIDGYE